MRGIGAVLRREREKRKFTLDDIAEKTKIRTKYLQAIEDEEFEILPGAVYVRGFISSYIKCLGIGDLPEVQEIMQTDTAVQENAQEEEKAVVQARERTKPQKIEEEPLNKKSSVIILLSVLAVCALLAVQWLFSGGLSNDVQEKVPPQVEQQPEENLPVEPVEPVVPAQPIYEGLVMELTIIDLTVGVQDKCWLEVKGDGVQILNTTLVEGQTVQLEAKEILNLHLGNAGVVQITLNGQDLGTMGEKGKVVTREFTLNDVAQ
ncbi:MAG: DUF4115 domain-containing protein [Peptococcaceae bacterium]|nr:DUF4115 domain-containing protein [Peptococcaceae bacterium]